MKEEVESIEICGFTQSESPDIRQKTGKSVYTKDTGGVYLFKPHEYPNTAKNEVFCARLYRFLGGADFAPETVLATSNYGEIIGVMTRYDSKFQSAKTITNLTSYITQDKRGFAKLIATAFLLGENDLNCDNFGIANNKFFRVDPAQSMFFLLLEQIPAIADKVTEAANNPEEILETPNLAFYRDTSKTEQFNSITSVAIQRLPFLSGGGFEPFNPIEKDLNPQEIKYLESLRTDPEFQKWVHFYLLKGLILNEQLIKDIIGADSNDQFETRFADALSLRMHKLTDIFKKMPTIIALLENNCDFLDGKVFLQILKEELLNDCKKSLAQEKIYGKNDREIISNFIERKNTITSEYNETDQQSFDALQQKEQQSIERNHSMANLNQQNLSNPFTKIFTNNLQSEEMAIRIAYLALCTGIIGGITSFALAPTLLPVPLLLLAGLVSWDKQKNHLFSDRLKADGQRFFQKAEEVVSDLSTCLQAP